MKSLRLRNFRSFRDTGEVPLRPITVLVGENSSGKSSFARFFPLIQQSLARATDGPLLWFGPAVDLGDHATAVRRASPQQPIEVEMTLQSDRGAIWGDTRIGLKIGFHDGSSVIQEMSISRADRPVRFERDPQSRDSKLTSPTGSVYPLGALDRPRVNGENLLTPFVDFAAGVPGASEDRPAAPEPVRDFWQSVVFVNLRLAEYFRRLTYSRPFRVAPERYTRAQNVSVDAVESDGGNLPEFLISLSPGESSELSAWCDRHLGFGLDAVRDGAHIQVRAIGPSGLAVNVADMGFGVGQVLPVAVQLWAAARDWGPSSRRNVTMMVMEQPELHLHPRMQGKLADILAGAVKTAADQHRSLTLIVETHSEALLNRLGELIEGDGTTGAAPLLRPEDVTVALFEKDSFDGDSTVTLTSFDESGALKKWPLGFFSR